MSNKKSVMEATTIHGADGPTSVFLLSKPKKLTLRQWIQKKRYSIKEKWIEKHIGIENHSIMEVCEYIQNKYGFIEVCKDTLAYKEDYVQMRYGFLMQYAPELLGKYAKPPEMASHSEEDIKTYFKEIEIRQKMAQAIPTTDFDIKLHIYKKAAGDVNDTMHITVEENYGHISGGASGNKRVIKKFNNLYRNIYKYYGVTEEDVRSKSERYEKLIHTLAR